jgi:hypothetical protein
MYGLLKLRFLNLLIPELTQHWVEYALVLWIPEFTDSWNYESWIYGFLKLWFLNLRIPESTKNIFYQFIRERNNLNVTFVTLVVL